ncbi:TetR family transcriptional regulator [Burkholderia pyrrocinia]|uniref:TetR family transcriptional regulator n=1 Tax=Burkholderia pyrrocinia TaxID=60550 RepID=A0A2Z5N8D0_BURPY|nr:TetR/AcrR family transcriptional regulator [Burkholderia pyrrocinia]AXF25819.1 TetR family transcriptional regulator [Burkholderia pyrrocinia]
MDKIFRSRYIWNKFPLWGAERCSAWREAELADNDKKLKSAATTRSAQRSVRADAQRNIDSILRTAAQSFACSGVDVSVREIAESAGVGVGTLYRHFPTRSDLVVAVFRKEVDACVDTAPVLAANYSPVDALARWVAHYVDFIVTRRGLAAALNSGDPTLEGLPAYFHERLWPVVQGLLDAAAAEGKIRAGVKSYELLHAVAMLCVPSHCGEPIEPQRMVGVFMDGLRYRADRDVEGHRRQGTVERPVKKQLRVP